MTHAFPTHHSLMDLPQRPPFIQSLRPDIPHASHPTSSAFANHHHSCIARFLASRAHPPVEPSRRCRCHLCFSRTLSLYPLRTQHSHACSPGLAPARASCSRITSHMQWMAAPPVLHVTGDRLRACMCRVCGLPNHIAPTLCWEPPMVFGGFVLTRLHAALSRSAIGPTPFECTGQGML